MPCIWVVGCLCVILISYKKDGETDCYKVLELRALLEVNDAEDWL